MKAHSLSAAIKALCTVYDGAEVTSIEGDGVTYVTAALPMPCTCPSSDVMNPCQANVSTHNRRDKRRAS